MIKIENELNELEKLKIRLKDIIDIDSCIEYYKINNTLINLVSREITNVENIITTLRNVKEDKEYVFEEE